MKPDDPQSEMFEAIAASFNLLCEKLAVVRQTLDEILEELQWANRNRPDRDRSWNIAPHLTSMPVDPSAPDWAERLNRYTAADLPADENEESVADPGRLF